MEPGQWHHILHNKMKEIRNYLIRLGASKADAEDIVQDTMYKAILYMESIDSNKFSAWLYKVSINGYYDLYRRNKRIHIPVDSIELTDEELPDDKLLQKEERERIERTLDKMKPIHKQMIILKYELDFSYQEMSDLLGVKVETIKSTLFRARKKFQDIYRGEEQ